MQEEKVKYDVVSWGTLIHAFAKGGRLTDARKALKVGKRIKHSYKIICNAMSHAN